MMLQYIYEALLVSKGFFDLSNINSLLISVFDYISYITKVL